MDISDAVRIIRCNCLLSQQEFADVLGVSFSTVNRWENGKAVPNYQKIKKLLDFCKNNNVPFTIILQEWQDNRVMNKG